MAPSCRVVDRTPDRTWLTGSPRSHSRHNARATSVHWVGTERGIFRPVSPSPLVITVRATFIAHGDRSVGLFSSSSGDMDLGGESKDSPTYPRFQGVRIEIGPLCDPFPL